MTHSIMKVLQVRSQGVLAGMAEPPTQVAMKIRPKKRMSQMLSRFTRDGKLTLQRQTIKERKNLITSEASENI